LCGEVGHVLSELSGGIGPPIGEVSFAASRADAAQLFFAASNEIDDGDSAHGVRVS
jgi:hypothetical protein